MTTILTTATYFDSKS